MSLKVITNIPAGNAGLISVRNDGDPPEVVFAAEPCGGPEALWFCFRLIEGQPDTAPQGKVKLTLLFFQNLLGAGSPADCIPVYRPANQGWFRMSGGSPSIGADGQVQVSWLIPRPAPWIDVAFCYPYLKADVQTFVDRTKGYWKSDEIGLSQGGRPLARLSNDYGQLGGSRRGLYLIARQHAGETPGSWVLEGFLQHFAKAHKDPCLIWAIPLADADGVARGHYGKDEFPYDLNRAWGFPAMRHEVLAYQRDVERWKARCHPVLAIDFHAPGACETEGIYTFLPAPDQEAAMREGSEKWANVIQQELGPEFAAANFKRVATYASRWNTPMFAAYMTKHHSVCALSIEIPYAKIGSTVLAQKHYREAGDRIARGVIKKL